MLCKVEYAIEIYDAKGDFVKQVDVANTFSDAISYIQSDVYDIRLEPGERYGIMCIEYDSEENEIEREIVYLEKSEEAEDLKPNL